ncbi:O-antigen ligase family protein [Chitinolyticbacter meiyuanensis]|uniref:O-antigen ligase family protein n=1 Tax=Chitinolyticbacter meiyuanensis TaxID=682798 RepID=UPI0016524C8F|nr:O-antigen ligase family protein [Chitinolyticbacter meiyuanensis]
MASSCVRKVDRAFSMLLVYYFLLQFFVFEGVIVGASSVLYFAFVVPSFAVCLVGYCFSFMTRGFSFSRVELVFLGFFFFSLFVCLFRSDIDSAKYVIALSLLPLFVFRLRPSVSVGLINFLFIFSIFATTAAYFFGYSNYLPVLGFSKDGQLPWRGSLLPQVATGAIFSLLVFVVNLSKFGEGRRYRILVVLAAAMVIFSGLRTAIICMFLALLYFVFLFRKRSNSHFFCHLAVVFLFTALFVVFVLSTQIILLLQDYVPIVLFQYLFRGEAGYIDADSLRQSVYRGWLWLQHILIWQQNPLWGFGSFTLDEMTFGEKIAANGTGSESFFTGLLARCGIVSAFLFVLALVLNANCAFKNGWRHSLIILLLFFITMLSYGSYVNSYDFLAMLFFSLLSVRPR